MFSLIRATTFFHVKSSSINSNEEHQPPKIKRNYCILIIKEKEIEKEKGLVRLFGLMTCQRLMVIYCQIIFIYISIYIIFC